MRSRCDSLSCVFAPVVESVRFRQGCGGILRACGGKRPLGHLAASYLVFVLLID
jgi:hypothetical protein